MQDKSLLSFYLASGFNKFIYKNQCRSFAHIIAFWGLSFKPQTDDMREAPSLVLIDLLLEAGAKVRAYDPIAIDEAKRRVGDKVTYCNDMYDAALNSDAILLVTEWKEFRMPSWEIMKKTMNTPLIIDGRNIYDRKELNERGLDYFCIG